MLRSPIPQELPECCLRAEIGGTYGSCVDKAMRQGIEPLWVRADASSVTTSRVSPGTMDLLRSWLSDAIAIRDTG